MEHPIRQTYTLMTNRPRAHQNVLIVDPIFRGSRLFYSWMVSGAFPSHSIDVVTRTDAWTEQAGSFFLETRPRLIECVETKPDFWYGKIPPDQQRRMVEAMVAEDRSRHYGAIFFSGVNELYPNILDLLASEFAAPLAGRPMVMVEYDARFLLRPSAELPPAYAFRRETFARAFAAVPGLRVALLDERALDPEFSGLGSIPFGDRYFLLPDPIPGLSGPGSLTSRREPDPFVAGDGIKCLLVGIQSKRKGLTDVLAALNSCSEPDRMPTVFLSGKLEPDTELLRPAIESLKGRLDWREEYVPEDLIRRTYASCDYVIMPYDRSFHGSSGVLAYAAAYGKPLLVTDHGCIGYRVEKFGLGRTYPSGRPDLLASALRGLPAPGEEEYEAMSRNCLNYAKANSMDKFQEIVRCKLDPESNGAENQ